MSKPKTLPEDLRGDNDPEIKATREHKARRERERAELQSVIETTRREAAAAQDAEAREVEAMAENPDAKPGAESTVHEQLDELLDQDAKLAAVIRKLRDRETKGINTFRGGVRQSVVDCVLKPKRERTLEAIAELRKCFAEEDAAKADLVDRELLDALDMTLGRPHRLLFFLDQVGEVKGPAELAIEFAQARELEKERAKRKATEIEEQRREADARYRASRGMAAPLVEVLRTGISKITG